MRTWHMMITWSLVGCPFFCFFCRLLIFLRTTDQKSTVAILLPRARMRSKGLCLAWVWTTFWAIQPTYHTICFAALMENKNAFGEKNKKQTRIQLSNQSLNLPKAFKSSLFGDSAHNNWPLIIQRLHISWFRTVLKNHETSLLWKSNLRMKWGRYVAF